MNRHRRHLARLPRLIDFYFDQGNAQSVSEENGKIKIVPYQYVATSTWVLFSVRSDRLAGAIPHFIVPHDRRYGGTPSTLENMAVWSVSPETDQWYKFDNQIVDATNIEFYNNTPFPRGTVYISYLPLYQWSRRQRLFLEWIKDSRVVLNNYGQDTRRPVRDGRVAPALPYLGLKLTNSSGFSKKYMILASGNHPNETEGPFMLEGAMAWLLGGTPQAEMLLDYFDVLVYPCINPQGVMAGYTRSGPQHYDAWHGDFETPPTFGVSYDDIDALKAKMESDTGTDIEVGVDFHGTVGNYAGYMDSNDHTETLYARLLALIQSYYSAFTYVDEVLDYTTTGVWRNHYSAALSPVIEGGARAAINISDWKNLGKYTMQSLATMLAEGRFACGPGVGSRDLNGTTDRIDRSSAHDFTGHPLTVSMFISPDAVSANGYVLTLHASGDASSAMLINISDAVNKYIGFIVVAATTSLQRSSTAQGVVTGGMHNYIITWDGVVTSYSGVHIYKDNVELSYSVSTNGSGSQTPPTGTWSFGGRKFDDARNVDMKGCQLRLFDRVITADERALETAGVLTTTAGLVSWLKANTSDLHDAVDDVLWVADGSTQLTGVGNGPTIVY